MATASSTFRVGLFVLLGAAALFAGVVLVGTQEGLFHPTFRVSAYVNSVEGVRSGSAVRLDGVDIGIVDGVEVSPRDNKVRLDLKLNAGAKGFVRKDSYATIRPEGLVGNYYVDVTVGSPAGEQIEDGDLIRSREAIRLTDVLDNTDAIMENIRRSSGELTKTLAAINEGHGTLGKLIASEEIYRHLEHMSSQADAGVTGAVGKVDTLSVSVRDVVHRADSVLANMNAMCTRLNGGEGTIGALLTERTIYDSLLLAVRNTVRATDEAKVGAGRFAEDMEALKHNWFFKGYFEDRGYWDDADHAMELDRKIDSLKTLERRIAGELQELGRHSELAPK
jgi:phospholipid/cholesterol/gamma-HCH transport system substrate-binding protein